jgi:hypothetical protein
METLKFQLGVKPNRKYTFSRVVLLIFYFISIDPIGNSVPTKSITNRDNTWRVEYCPNEVGKCEYKLLMINRNNWFQRRLF